MKAKRNPRPQAGEGIKTSNNAHKDTVFASLLGQITVTIPAIESLYKLEDKESFWPETVRKSIVLRTQVAKREQLASELRWLFQRMTSTQSEPVQLIEQRIISMPQLISIYEMLIAFMKTEETGARLLLYLPSALIPTNTSSKTVRGLEGVLSEFRIVCRNAWQKLLEEQDIRADFSDGDIIEPEISSNPIPMVCKAAHLIPLLVLKRIISSGDVFIALQEAHDDVLRHSIADALMVLGNMNLLSQFHLDLMKDSENRKVRYYGYALLEQKPEFAKPGTPVERNGKWLKQMTREIEGKLKELRETYAENICDMPAKKARRRWLHQEAIRKLIERYSSEIATGMMSGSIFVIHMKTFIYNASSIEAEIIGLRAIRKAVEEIAPLSLHLANILRAPYDRVLRNAVASSIEVLEEVQSILSRWRAIGTIDEAYVKPFGITIPNGEAPVLRDLLQTSQAKDVIAITASITKNEALLRIIYPVVLMYGSQVKGYGLSGADCDIAIFIRPETSFSDRERLHQLLSETISGGVLKNKPLEFWLSNDGTIRSGHSFDPLIGDAFLPHVLFGGMLIGNAEDIRSFYAGLLSNYFILGKTNVSQRRLCLKELERGYLQYRLMHKGYARLFPEQKDAPSIAYSSEIDGESMFWDAGYRMFATVLFVEKVFIPML